MTFDPQGVVVMVPAGETVLRAAARAEIFLSSPCGGAGSCGKCLIRVTSGEVVSEPSVKISAEDWSQGARLACSSRVYADVTVQIPESTTSWMIAGDRSEMPERLRVTYAESPRTPSQGAEPLDPAVFRVVVSLSPPGADDRASDLNRLLEALAQKLGVKVAQIGVTLDAVRELPELLRENDWAATVTMHNASQGPEVIEITGGVDLGAPLLAAFDIGTTTVWGQLVDLATGAVLATSASFNRQIQFGEDVISRMVRARERGGRERLQRAVLDTMNEILVDLASQAGVAERQIVQLVASGNTTMSCLLLDIDTRYLRLEPYVPPIGPAPAIRAGRLGAGLRMNESGLVEMLPCIASYVGGDVVAGVLTSGMAAEDDICLYLDMGTNGEAVIGNREWLLATSCSAGPAFEGGGIRHGMRATAGAIESVVLDPKTLELSILTVDDKPPVGICGSGVIDAVAEMLRAGILLPSGRFNRQTAVPGLVVDEDGPRFVLVPAEFSGTGEDIALTEIDIENLVRAKAAMFAGVTTLLQAVSLEWTDLSRIIVGGSFGRSLRIDQAITIGLFPEIDSAKFEFVGNGSLQGTRLVGLSRMMGREAERIASLMGTVEMADNTVFHEQYMQALFLPHTDLAGFPAMERILNAQRRQN